MVPASRMAAMNSDAITIGLFSGAMERRMASLPEEVELVLDPDRAHCTDGNGGEQHDPLDQRLQQGINVKNTEIERHYPQDHRTDDAADRAADAAEQRGAAEHDRGDGVQRVDAGLLDIGIAGRGLDRKDRKSVV